jgi:hypothetical protein
MGHPVTCPHCDAPLYVAEDVPGAFITCPACRKHIPAPEIRAGATTALFMQTAGSVVRQDAQPRSLPAGCLTVGLAILGGGAVLECLSRIFLHHRAVSMHSAILVALAPATCVLFWQVENPAKLPRGGIGMAVLVFAGLIVALVFTLLFVNEFTGAKWF